MIDPEHIAHMRGLAPHLSARIRGQDHLLPRIADAFARAALALPDSERPAASMLLVGPTGTGKSKTFLDACEYTFGPGRCAIFDMSEYQDQSAVNKLLGESRNDVGILGGALHEIPPGGLLFDEIEKAHRLVVDLFLQILWRGCITVATGRTYRLGGYVVGFTSNIGAADAIRMMHSSFASIEQATLRRIGQSLRPEFVGRLDEKLVFARLSPAVQAEICSLEIAAETNRLRGLGYDLTVSPEVLEFLMREGFSPDLGARPLHKAVATHVQKAVLKSLYSTGAASGELAVELRENCLRILAS
jgi:ATP-dependent Clp protease ATP-binding subunit ClpA